MSGDTSMLPLLAFYLGRLSARDDTKDWNKIALGRVAELQDKALDDRLRNACIGRFLENHMLRQTRDTSWSYSGTQTDHSLAVIEFGRCALQ